ncbi:MAG: O-antigen ligase family protein [Nitrospirota bacterium]
MNNANRFQKYGPWLLFAHLLLSPTLFGRGLVEVFEFPKAAVLMLTAILLLALWGWEMAPQFLLAKEPIKTSEKKKRRIEVGIRKRMETLLGIRLNDPITIGVSLFLVSSIFSTLFSISPRTSFYGEDDSNAGLITIISYTILFFGTKMLCKHLAAFRTLFVATLLGMALSVFYASIQAAKMDPFTWKRMSEFGEAVRIFGTMGHPNQLGAFLLMGFPILCYFRLQMFEKRTFYFIPAASLIALEIFSAATIVLSLSRGAWLATIIVLILFTTGVVILTGKKQFILWLLIPALIGAGLGRTYFRVTSTNAPPTAVMAAEPETLDPLEARTRQLGFSVITEGSRWPIWVAAVHMFADHPLLGVGPDAFHLAFMKYRPDNYWLREWGGTPTRAHNELLHILATGGVFGGIAVCVLTFGIFTAFIREARASQGERPLRGFNQSLSDRTLLLAVFSGAIGFYIQNMFNFTVTGFATLFITFCAFLSRWGEPEFFLEATPLSEERVPAQKTFAVFIGQGAILFFALSAIYLLVAKPFYTSRFVAQTIFDRSLPAADSAVRLEKAVLLDATKDDYFHYLGAAYRKIAGKSKENPALREKSFLSAKAAYQQAIDLVPVDSNNHIKLATLLVVMAKESPPLATPDEVYRSVKTAIALDPKNADLYLIGADIAISFGDSIRAKRWAEQSAAIYPHFGPPRAQIGFAILLDAVRVLRANKPAEGEKMLQEVIANMEQSLPLFWANHTGKKTATENDLATAYLFRAKAKEQLGEIENARAAYEKLFAFKPNHAEGLAAFKKFHLAATYAVGRE